MSGSKAPRRLWLPTLAVAVLSFLSGIDVQMGMAGEAAAFFALALFWAFMIRMTVRTAIMEARADEQMHARRSSAR